MFNLPVQDRSYGGTFYAARVCERNGRDPFRKIVLRHAGPVANDPTGGLGDLPSLPGLDAEDLFPLRDTPTERGQSHRLAPEINDQLARLNGSLHMLKPARRKPG